MTIRISELKELAFAADVLFKNDKFISQEVDIVSREGPSGTGKGKGKKNKKGKNPEGEGEPNERGFKTASLQEKWTEKMKLRIICCPIMKIHRARVGYIMYK